MATGFRAMVMALCFMAAGAFLPGMLPGVAVVRSYDAGSLRATVMDPRVMQQGVKPIFAKKDSNKESDVIEVDGIVKESLPNAKFRVELVATKAVIVCSTSGKMRKNFVRVLVGDPVKVELSPYDLTRGRITYRSRAGKSPPPPPPPEGGSS